ncbi:PA14 domain-containing protein [Streptomyces sp. ME02-8801-2C]|uniref:PA14 domain-containing protein n=1 Tax=Streptomyces sp. ME02-8801-2C TaxID=3028680 RepID=UPI0029AA4BF5|nr:PA14 domain-containing protein [Streptomyces sp. ME02-8801-2C]MDX3453774.1 PA14 domain-containing protein [Streptomyces sp. ME02-8801-2C]
MNPARRAAGPAITATAVVLVSTGALLTTAAPFAAAATTCNSPVFKRQFFANTALSGTPRRTDCDSVIAENWGAGAPATGLPKDNFGVRWTVTRDFGSGGPFAFTLAAQDGIRVYLDGKRRVDLWKNTSSTVKKTVNVDIPSGKHALRIDYANWTGSANVQFGYAPRTSASTDRVKPLVPVGAAVTYDKSSGTAKLTWSRNKEMDLAGYRVYRRLKSGSFGSRPLMTTVATTYIDTALPKTGAMYYYEVRARDKAGHDSSGTADLPVTTVDKTPPAAPSVAWDACPGDQPYAAPQLVTTAQNQADIAWYEMQRLVTGIWTTVYSGPKGAICDAGYPADGSKVTYRGRARDAAGNWSLYSAATTFTTPDLTPPAPVADARVEYRSGVPHLIWSPVSGASAYQVVQYDPATSGWLDALPGGGTTKETDAVPRQLAATADTYRYAVRSTDAGGNAAARAEVTLSMADRPEAIPPYETTANRAGPGVVVSWSSADPWTYDDGPLLTYQILRTDPATGESTVVDKCKSGIAFDERLTDPSVNWWWAGDDAPAYAGRKVLHGSCWDVSGASRTTYEYRIVTVDRYGHASQPGAAATATTPDTERPAPVRNLTAEELPLGVRLTWTPPADDDIAAYYVWQGITDPDTGDTVWKKNCWKGDSLAETEILCPTVPDGSTHVYRVAATDDWAYIEEGPDFFHTADISVTLSDTRPPGWTGTGVRQGQYPALEVGCEETDGLGDCSLLPDYRVDRWDPASGSYTTLTTAKVGRPTIYMDHTVHADLLNLYYYRVVFTGTSGVELATRQVAYGIWNNWL